MMALAHEGLRPHIEALRPWNDEEEQAGFVAHFEPRAIQIIQVEHRDVGYFKLVNHGSHRFLEGIYLASSVRNRGLGTAVLKALMAENTALRLRVLHTNPARALYRRLGFRLLKSAEQSDTLEFRPGAAP